MGQSFEQHCAVWWPGRDILPLARCRMLTVHWVMSPGGYMPDVGDW